MDCILEDIRYKELINPKVLFSSIEEFEEFVNIDCSEKDLLCFLELCEKEECYEYCKIINDKLNSYNSDS